MSEGPVKLLPDLYKISDFIVSEHPEYHPDSVKYEQYWEDHEKKCIEGVWGHDFNGVDGGWRYMPGFLYYYINFSVMELVDRRNNATKIENPYLRDVEWLLSYGWISARGFSGFMDDKEYTCHRIIKKLESGKELSPDDEMTLEYCKKDLINPETGEYKKYIDAREYLYNTHEKPLGLPLYQNTAVNFFVLGSRGFGKSYFCANAVIGHEFKFFGKKYVDTEYLKMKNSAEIFVGAAQADKSQDLLNKFLKTEEYQKEHWGSWGSGDDFEPGFFSVNTTGSLATNGKPYRHEFKFNKGGVWLTGGTGTFIKHGVYTTENPDAAVGTRPSVMVIEEVGLLTNLLKVHGANETCQWRDYKFGSSFYIGTGGNMEKIIESKQVFEDPESYNFLPYKDHWENRVKPIGFFLPAYYVDNKFKDEFGNTKLELAYKQEMIERKKRESSSSTSSLDKYIVYRPIVPSEMFLSPAANVFPTAKLRERDAKMQVDNLFEIRASIGELEWEEGGLSVIWKEDLHRKKKPIIKLNLDTYKGNITGSVVIYEHPVDRIPNPTYKKSLYKVVYDPVQDDQGGTSLASILVYKGFVDGNWNMGLQDAIVAEYIGRYDQVRDIHEIAIKLATYYNAKVLVENNIPDFIRYCKMKGYVHRLQISPYEAISKGVKNASRKYEYGVHMSKQLSTHCEQLARQWFLDVWGTTEDGKPLTNIDKIFSPRLIEEAIIYDGVINTDHISSLKLLMLWLSQEKLTPVRDAENSREKDRYAELDSFLDSRMKSLNISKNPYHVY